MLCEAEHVINIIMIQIMLRHVTAIQLVVGENYSLHMENCEYILLMSKHGSIHPSRYKTLNQCQSNAGPPSSTMDQL